MAPGHVEGGVAIRNMGFTTLCDNYGRGGEGNKTKLRYPLLPYASLYGPPVGGSH